MKKIISFVLVCLMLCTGAFALTGCKKKTDPYKKQATEWNKNKELAIDTFYENIDSFIHSNAYLLDNDRYIIFDNSIGNDMTYFYEKYDEYATYDMSICYHNVIYFAHYSEHENDGNITLFGMEKYEEMSVEGQIKDGLFLLPASEIESIKIETNRMLTYSHSSYCFIITYKNRPGYFFEYHFDSDNFQLIGFGVSEENSSFTGTVGYYENDRFKSFVKFNIEPFSTITELVIDTEDINLNDLESEIAMTELLPNITKIIFDNHHEDIELPDYILEDFEFSENVDGKAIYIKKVA